MKLAKSTKLLAAVFAVALTVTLSGNALATVEEQTPTPSENIADVTDKLNGTLPDGYELIPTENGKVYVLEGKSHIRIEGMDITQFLDEELSSLEDYAHEYCVFLAMAMQQSIEDPEFRGEPDDVDVPLKTKVAGFPAVYYDYNVTANDFVRDENGATIKVDRENNVVKEGEDGVLIKIDRFGNDMLVFDENEKPVLYKDIIKHDMREPIGFYTGKAVFFYTDKEAYAITFETETDNWDELSGGFESYLNSLSVDGAVVPKGAANAEVNPAIAMLIVLGILIAATVIVAVVLKSISKKPDDTSDVVANEK